ncbi:unnamed protein product, partial [marine sediment metagenome]
MGRYFISWHNNYFIQLGGWLAEPRYSAGYDLNKIVVRQTGDSLVAALDTQRFVIRDNLYSIIPFDHDNLDCLKIVLGILNSKLLNWVYQSLINYEKGEALAQVKRGHIAQLPIPTPVVYLP